MKKKVSVSQARKILSKIVEDVSYNGDLYIIYRNGKPKVKIIPFGTKSEFEKHLDEFMEKYKYALQKLADS